MVRRQGLGRRHRCLDLVNLAGVAGVDEAPERHVVRRDPLLRQRPGEGALHLRVEGGKAVEIRRLGGGIEGAHQVVRHIRPHQPRRAEHARPARHDHAGYAEPAGKCAGLQRPSTAAHQQRVGPRVDATFDREEPHGAREPAVHDFDDSRRGAGEIEAKGLGDPLLDGPVGERRLKRRAPTQEVVRVDVAEMHECIGERRLGSAPAVAGGARIGARALWSHAERAARIEPCDRTAARADGVDIDRGDGDGLGVEALRPGDRDRTARQHAHVEAGAAGVDGHDVRAVGQLAVIDAGERAAAAGPLATSGSGFLRMASIVAWPPLHCITSGSP